MVINKKHAENGTAFSLIEIVVALGIVTFTIAGLLSLLVFSSTTLREDAVIQEAELLADALEIEISSLSPGPETATYPNGPFEKAADWVINSHNSTSLILCYHYRGKTGEIREDGTLVPLEELPSDSPSFSQSGIRRLKSGNLSPETIEDLAATKSRVFLVRLTQLVPRSELLSELVTVPTSDGVNALRLNLESATAFDLSTLKSFPAATIRVNAELFELPVNVANALDAFLTGKSFTQLTNSLGDPVLTGILRFSDNMKTRETSGFTLFELLVAMTVTSLIALLLAATLNSTLNQWNRGADRAQLSNQIELLFDKIAGDLESLVVRAGNGNEWLVAACEPSISQKGIDFNRTLIVFLTAPTDRYNGERTEGAGDVSCVAYEGAWQDPIAGDDSNANFGIYRRIINPDLTYDSLLGQTDLLKAYHDLPGETTEAINLLTDNIIDFTLTFEIQYHDNGPKMVRLPISILASGDTKNGSSIEKVNRLSWTGYGLSAGPEAGNVKWRAGEVTAIDISVQMLSESGAKLIQAAGNATTAPKIVAKHTYQFSRRISPPRY